MVKGKKEYIPCKQKDERIKIKEVNWWHNLLGTICAKHK
jgi:hypothetical protein